MNETIDLAWIGGHIRTLQADMRSLNQRLDQMQRNSVTRQDVLDAVNLLVQRVATSEALFETRFDQLAAAIAALKD